MPIALRPYVTTGVALVGATVIAAAPLAPVTPDVQISNPAIPAVERGVQLSANEIQTAINRAIFAFVASPTVQGAELLGRLLKPILGEEQAAQLPLAALGFAGPLISGGGSVGTALQNIVDSEGLEETLFNLIGALGTVIDGSVNGGYGPDLWPLVGDILVDADPLLAAAVAALELLGQPLPTVFSGGLINLQSAVLKSFPIPFPPGVLDLPVAITLPGAIPVLQRLIGQLFAPEEVNASLALVAEDDRVIEDGVNELLYAVTAVTLRVATLAAPLVAPILDVSNDEAAQFLAVGTLGFIGPLIGGTGGLGHAIQDLVGSDDFGNFLDNSLDLVRLPIDGAVNGGQFGPNLAPLLPFLPSEIPVPTPAGPIDVPVDSVFAPGLIPNAGYTYSPLGIGAQPIGGSPISPPTGFNLTTPGTIPTLQGLVGQLFDRFDPEEPALQAKTAGDNVALAGKAAEGGAKDVKKDATKRNRPLLNLVKNTLGADAVNAKSAGSTGKHRIGTPVRDLINKVVNGGKKKSDDAPKADADDAEK